MKIKNKEVFICDIESDGFLDTMTKIHCLGMAYEKEDGTWDVKTTTKYTDIKSLFESDCIIVGHNFISYDVPAVKKIIPDVNASALPLASETG